MLAVAVCIASSCRALGSMQEDVGLRLRADTRVVQIDVAVRDSHGKPVDDLTSSDFTVTDNGKPRSFTIFSVNRITSVAPDGHPETPEALPPRPTLPPNVFTNKGAPARPPEGHSTIILLDGMNGWFDNFAWARRGVLGMLTKVPADEKIALYVISRFTGMEILQDYTTDRGRLIHVMTTFIPRGMSPAPPYMPEGLEGMIDDPDVAKKSNPAKQPPREKAYFMQSASESVRMSMNALAERLKPLPGRKSVFWVTQGFPPVQLRDMNGPAWDKTLAALNDANIAVNTVDSNGLGGPPRLWGNGAILSMQQVAERTGGQAYFHRNNLDAAMASGIADSRSGYTLGFYLTEVDGKYHELKVHVDRPGLDLSYRQGYYARSENVVDASAKKSDLDAALLNPLDATAVGITASLSVTSGTPRSTLNAQLNLDPESLSLKESAGGWTGKVEELFLELNADGREVARLSDTKQFELTAGYKPKFDSQGVSLAQVIPLMPGAVRLSIVVRDTASGRMGSLTVPLDKVVPAK